MGIVRFALRWPYTFYVLALLILDGANCVLIGVESPIELSYFVSVGVNLAVALCSADTLAGVLLSLTPQVVSSRRGLIIEGVATLRGIGILYRSMLLPLSEDGATIDHLLGAASYRSLRSNEALSTQVHFRRLPIVPPRNAVAKRRPG
jgi:hypothetical protein